MDEITGILFYRNSELYLFTLPRYGKVKVKFLIRSVVMGRHDHLPCVTALHAHINPFVFIRVDPRIFLIVGTEEGPVATLMNVSSILQQEAYHFYVLIDNRQVQRRKTVVILGDEDVVDQFRVGDNQLLSQFSVCGRRLQKTHTKKTFAHCA